MTDKNEKIDYSSIQQKALEQFILITVRIDTTQR